MDSAIHKCEAETLMTVPVDKLPSSKLVSTHALAGPIVEPIDDAVARHRSSAYWSWRRIFDSDPCASPLQHPDVILAELGGGRVKSHLKPALVYENPSSDQNAIGILIPKTIRTSQVGGVGPEWTLHGLRLAGSRILGDSVSLHQQIRILECAAQYAEESNADFLLFEDLDESTSLYQAVQFQAAHGSLLFEAKEFQSRHFIDFPATADEYWQTFSSHCRKLFRRALKKCAEARLERITEVHQVADFLHNAHEISQRSWQSQQLGLRIRNDETELRQMTALAIQGMLRCYLYRIDGKPAAFAVGNQHANCFRYEETGFCPELRHYSPGRTMLLQILSDLLQHNTPKCFDFGFGDADYKQQFTNRESRSGTVWLVPPTLRARMSLSHLNVCRRIRSVFYQRIKHTSFGTEARQWIRSLTSAPKKNVAVMAAQESHESAEASFV